MITFLICCVCELAWVLVYGLLLNSFLPIGILFFIALGIAFCVNMIFYKKLSFNNKMVFVAICSLILAVLSIFLYDGLNRISSDLIAEYEVEVEETSAWIDKYAYFTDPAGRYVKVALNDYRPILTDEYISEGDVIKVREYVGLFGDVFYVFMEKVILPKD